MKTTKRIVATLAVILLAVVLTYICVEAASTSSGNSVEDRRSALTGAFMSLILGCLTILAVWIPWKKILNKKS